MCTFITYRMPVWFPCLVSTLVAFAVSLRPAMTLPTLPPESGLQGLPPAVAILGFTVIGFAWGLILTCLLAKSFATNNR